MNPELKFKRLAAIVLFLYFILGYESINHWSQTRTTFFSVALPGEEQIPFYPIAIIGYLIVYLSLISLYFITPPGPAFRKLAKGYFWLNTIHYLFFILVPVKMIWRPEITPQTFIDHLAWAYFAIDPPYNCFPSLHVANTVMAAALAWPYRKHRFFFVSYALITAVSVVLVKQHYILDAVAGGVVALLIFASLRSKN